MSAVDYPALSALLVAAGKARPCLVLDRDRLDHNIATARSAAQLPVRVVAKSLACLPLLDRACAGVEAIGLMTFSAAMLEILLKERPAHSHLMGKPLPTAAVAQVLQAQPAAAEQVIWLVDTPDRAQQLADLAARLGRTLKVALELDVGLHRGGFAPQDLPAQIAALTGQGTLSLEGVMGYEPHLAKLPAPFLKGAQAAVDAALRGAGGHGLLNTGGSMTFGRYGTAQGATEVSLGSVLVKPVDFDLPATTGFDPALFIAAPILKYLPGNPMPGPRWASKLSGREKRADLVVYGGYWKGQPVHPAGYKVSGVFGHSSNQEIWSGPRLPRSPVDSFAFLRPTQSEAVLPEFGEVVVVSDGQIVDIWPCLPVAQ